MQGPIRFWRDVVLPVGSAMGVFCLLNFCWNKPFPDIELMRLGPPGVEHVPAQIGVYLVGSLLALALLARSLRLGTLDASQLGLGAAARQPWRWLVGLGMTAAFMTILLTTQEVQSPPRIGDYFFWFFFLLAATM